MKWQKRFGVEMFAVIVMIAVVSILSVYQYRWTGEISRTEQARLKSSLATSVRNFDQEFSYDFQQLCETFELDPEAKASAIESHVARQQESWTRRSSHAEIVGGLYIWKPGSSSEADLESLSPRDDRFQDENWPSDLDSLHRFLMERGRFLSSVRDDREAVYYPWTFFADAPALVRPIFQIAPRAHDSGSGVHTIGVLIIALNREYLERVYLPDLVGRHFGAPGQRNFVVSVRTVETPYRTIYLSDANFPIVTSSADAAVNLFDLVGDEARRRGHPPLQASAPGEQWQLVAQHPTGSLEQAVASWRRRNLAISLGLLAILAGSMALIVSVARRSKALAKMQMEFVAGVSHELCTPLAVINTAAENLADGIVENTEQMQEYGGLIRAQGRRLGRLVDEVLLFTAGRFGLSGYDLEPVDVAPIVTQSLSTSAAKLHDAGFIVSKEIDDNLPPIVADPSAVVTCIENLVSNAIKYSNSSKRIAIHAYEAASDTKPEVRIGVEDQGIGISSADLAHIFEPFYRVQSVRDNQIRGVGLGLYLVKRMMEDMGGRVSVTSEVGRGTAVVLHFPVADLVDSADGKGA
ncbi:MAG TPA: HAMP domain-containing sensor histidine kinase [Candidatus Acidoferrales bacterium]|jgi:signal transduction histidine kinase|nr:HAMP domain-containing sensor histidine kinase [Candidatus Acidoferrales bacterium]